MFKFIIGILFCLCLWSSSKVGQTSVETFRHMPFVNLDQEQVQLEVIQQSDLFSLEKRRLSPHKDWVFYQFQSEIWLLPRRKVFAQTLRLYSDQPEEDGRLRLYICMSTPDELASECNMILNGQGVMSCQDPCHRLVLML